MTNLLTESISIALEEAFGEEYTVYDDSVEQGLKELCFFVQCLESTNNRYRGKRYYRTHQFCIQYFPRDTISPRPECETVANRLYDVLECLTLHDDQAQLWGKNMWHNVTDGILNFFVHYDLFVLKAIETPFMGTLEQQMRGKKGDLPNDSPEN